MKGYYELTYLQVLISAGFVLAAGVFSLLLKLQLARRLWTAALRTALQLSLAGLVLEFFFDLNRVYWILLLALGMVLIAGREMMRRLTVRIPGNALDSLLAMTISSFTVAITVTGVIIGARPWWEPPVFIPLLGMILGNSLTGISIALDSFLKSCARGRREIEMRLLLGASTGEATLPEFRDAIRAGLIPIINAMSIVGLVSIPGMMTGQILAGADPADAVLYQIIVMYMIAAAASLGSILAVWAARRRLFTPDQALRPDLRPPS